MKYKIGDCVCYKDNKYTVAGICEESTIVHDEDGRVNADVDIYYDLKDGSEIRFYEVPEEGLKECPETNGIIELKNGATYKLKNNMVATYEEVNDLIITDEGISVPGHFYDKNGKCSAYASFDIVEELSDNIKEDDNNDLDPIDDCWLDWCSGELGEDEDEDKDEDEDSIEEDEGICPLTLTAKDKKYYITFDKSAYGWTFHGNLPQSIEEFLSKILNGRR